MTALLKQDFICTDDERELTRTAVFFYFVRVLQLSHFSFDT
jgi:hypothetical protein